MRAKTKTPNPSYELKAKPGFNSYGCRLLVSGDANRVLCSCEEGSAVLSSLMKWWSDAEWLNVSSLQLVCTTVTFWGGWLLFYHLTLDWVFALSPSVPSQGDIVFSTASVRQSQYQLRSIWHYLHLITQEGLCLLFGNNSAFRKAAVCRPFFSVMLRKSEMKTFCPESTWSRFCHDCNTGIRDVASFVFSVLLWFLWRCWALSGLCADIPAASKIPKRPKSL